MGCFNLSTFECRLFLHANILNCKNLVLKVNVQTKLFIHIKKKVITMIK